MTYLSHFLNESRMALVPRLGFKKLAASLETRATTTRKRHGPLLLLSDGLSFTAQEWFCLHRALMTVAVPTQ